MREARSRSGVCSRDAANIRTPQTIAADLGIRSNSVVSMELPWCSGNCRAISRPPTLASISWRASHPKSSAHGPSHLCFHRSDVFVDTFARITALLCDRIHRQLNCNILFIDTFIRYYLCYNLIMTIALNQGVLEKLSLGPASTTQLCQALKVSRPVMWRTLQPLEKADRIVRIGSTRGARYGLAHTIGAIGSHWPLYRIDEIGTPIELGTLHAIERDRYFARGQLPRIATLAEGLPYFLQDARPAGFLGRALPAAYPELGLPARVLDWTDDHVLTFLALRGSESTGDLILGQEALNRYLSDQHGPIIVNAHSRPTLYPELAIQAMAGAPPGSSAHGEHPKFSIRIGQGRELVHALVKFSPPRDSAFGERWADLLVAEGVASDFLNANGVPAATSRVLECGNRVFLESLRFDRIGAEGRRGVATLHSVDANYYGQLDRWSRSAERLRNDRLLSAEDAERVALLDAFGGLIANTDRHFGNITLFDDREGIFWLAPVYDMLPMLFAPAEGQLVEREFIPEGIRAETLRVWPRARELAIGYWTALTGDARLTVGFRERARGCLAIVSQLSARAGPQKSGSYNHVAD